MQVKKVVDAVKQEKNATRVNVGKENLDENVDDPPPALPVKPARAAKKQPQVQVLPTFEIQITSLSRDATMSELSPTPSPSVSVSSVS